MVLLDFDGTITIKDSLANFIQFAVGKPTYYMSLFKLSLLLTAYILKLIPNDIAKGRFVTHFFKGWDADHFKIIANQYSLEEIDRITRPNAIEKILWHQGQGHKVLIVSA